MPFHLFTTNTTAWSEQMMENFYYLSGDRLPYTTTAAGSLTSVDATYDLGSSTYRWQDVHTDNLVIGTAIESNSNTLWTLISSVELSAATTNVSFTGLSGDTSEEYKIVADIVCGYGSQYVILFENLVSDKCYVQHFYGVSGTALSLGMSDTAITITPQVDASTSSIFMDLTYLVKSGESKVCLSRWSGVKNSTTVYYTGESVGVRQGSTATSQIILYYWDFLFATFSSMDVGTKVQLWGRG